ncbi:LysR family transcriptional regulator [Vibrio hannami]|uniref:LysR family transcriptional regulator n=1 Tax=Vibrio hannami TaxID=2717094 RepID=UPI00240FD148|nr:LysR family transcriptional regulator [Vibrio hannami]MDG3086037.1 LysR family transcriptional regulator [Vibrio hannami]
MQTRSDDLEILLAVVDTGGFSAAAQALDIQVAKVSRAVTRLETQLGVSLLNRTTRRVDVTEEGKAFVDCVRKALSVIQNAEEDISSRSECPKGRLRVDAASPFVLHQLVPLVKPFRDEFPDIELEITSNEGYVDLLEKRTDVAIRIGKLADSTLHARLLGQSQLFIVASPEYLESNGMPKAPDDLLEHQLIGFTEPRVLNEWPLSGITAITPSISSSSGETVRQLALNGNGISCLSGFMVKEDISAGKLVSLFEQELSGKSERRQVNAVYYKSSAVSKRVSVFLDFIQPRLTL